MHKLVSVFLLTLAAHGLSATTLDPWRGWVAFKEFARSVDETPDPGVSVQFTRPLDDGLPRLIFVRQVVRTEAGRLEPEGGVVCEFTFPRIRRSEPDWQHWSFETSSFERFVDRVELEPMFQDLIVMRPIRSAVYWERA